MKVIINITTICSFMLLAIFISSCDREEEKTYPIAYAYEALDFKPTNWYVLTSNGQTSINQPYDIDAEVKDIAENVVEIPFKRMEFLSDSNVKLTFTDGINSLDTIITYSEAQGITKIHLGLTPEEDVIFYNGSESNTLILGVTGMLYSYKLPNGTVDYSPFEFEYSTETDPIKILNSLRQLQNLTLNDTVAVNILAYRFLKQ